MHTNTHAVKRSHCSNERGNIHTHKLLAATATEKAYGPRRRAWAKWVEIPLGSMMYVCIYVRACVFVCVRACIYVFVCVYARVCCAYSRRISI